ncbi:21119_t:CDS:10 [Entrophospora sp. SA101]|nr:6322_t:CDS:10 [Entrophospora sp. SA101]CAJ0759531.1 21119_t:CDS:10 [Entrophospora sp. SA101]
MSLNTVLNQENISLEETINCNFKLKEENEELKSEIIKLQEKIKLLESKLNDKVSSPVSKNANENEICVESNIELNGNKKSLTLEEYLRYGRQLILPGFGLSGQIKLKNASILVVGAGGLGAPAAIYLTSAGVGRLGIIDYDSVESSNLQRQIIHNESRTGISKAQSAKMTIQKLNSLCECIAYDLLLDNTNALEIIKSYDIVIDATDNVATRYLLNDACVILGKPLVSGSALRMEGQLTVYNHKDGPCYRCMFPKPPPPESVLNCADGGVLGVALLAIKIAINMEEGEKPHNLLLFSAADYPLFRSMKLRSKKPNCSVCGENPTITQLQNYVQFCGTGALDKSPDVKLLNHEERINVKTYNEIRLQCITHVLIDVRENVQFDICHLPGSINIPLQNLSTRLDEIEKSLPSPITPVCRHGNDSQHAVQLLKKITKGEVKDIIGGLYRWAKEVDNQFPIY